MNSYLEYLATLIENSTWLTPLIAFFAGVLTSISPCSLSSMPLTIAYISGTSNDTEKAFKFSSIIAIGMAITFSIMVIIAAILVQIVGKSSSIWFIIIGVIMVLMTLQLWEIFEFIPSTYLNTKVTKKGYVGALLMGILSGIFSSPCATPILVVILTLIANSENIINSAILLLLYSLGNSIFTIIAGTFTGYVRKISISSKYGIFSKISKILLGCVSLIFALYMFYLGF